MPDDATTPEDALAQAATDLLRQVEVTVEPWLASLVTTRFTQWSGRDPEEVADIARSAGAAGRAAALDAMRDLVASDPDRHRTNPLSILRDVTRHAAAALEGLGVPPIHRSDFDEQTFPDDGYGLVPATWSDVHPSLHDVGMAWGAAKAHVHLARRRDRPSSGAGGPSTGTGGPGAGR